VLAEITDPLNVAVGGGVFGMLTALFVLLLRTLMKAGDNADTRYQAEIERLVKEKAATEITHRAELETARAEALAAKAEAAQNRDRYEALFERLAPPGLIEDAAPDPATRRRRRAGP
jgi:hypothetical protein